MKVFPNAKINIGLDVLSRRPDGYHNISTVMVPVDWCDELEINELPGAADDRFVGTGITVDCPTADNLVMRAVKALRAEVTDLPRVEVHLHKQIPFGAGLGGGSADAAFTLTALNRMFGLGVAPARLAAIAATLGADCPVFVYNRPMLCEGIGDILTPISLPQLAGLHLLLVKPPVAVPTKAAYSHVVPHRPATPLPQLLALPIEQWQGNVTNDFEPSVYGQFPEIRAVAGKIKEMGAIYTAMSGSGATVYGIFHRDNLAEARGIFPADYLLHHCVL